MTFHNSLSGLPKHVIIDANVLLNATFVKNGHAQRGLAYLHALGYSPIIDEKIELEAHQALGKTLRNNSLASPYDLDKVLSDYITSSKILRLPAADQISNDYVNKSDRHVLSAAVHYSGWVLTGDLALIVELKKSKIQSHLPYDVVIEAETVDNSKPKLSDLFPFVPPARESGTLFGRVTAGNWAGGIAQKKHTICDIENVGHLYYDNAREAWVFKMVFADPVRIKCSLNRNEHWAVCGSYNLPGSGKIGKISIRAGKYPSTILQESKKTLKKITASSPGKITFGHSATSQHHWNGCLGQITIGPQKMSPKSWSNIIAIPGGAPNPYDNDTLSRVLRQICAVSIRRGLLVLPTEQDLHNLNF